MTPKTAFAGRFPRSRAAGLTLVELLIGITLGLVLVAGMIQLFISNKASYQLNESMSRVQENGRFAVQMLNDWTRGAGFIGCTHEVETIGNALAGSAPTYGFTGTFDPRQPLAGWEYTATADGDNLALAENAPTQANDSGNLLTTAGNIDLPAFAIVPGSDVLMTWSAGRHSAPLNDIVNPGALPTTLETQFPSGIRAGDIVVVSDCDQGASWAQVCSLSGDDLVLSGSCSPGNTRPPAVVADHGPVVGAMEASIFFVGKEDDDPVNPPTLFRLSLDPDGTADTLEALVEGVESLQITYGEDGGDSDRDADVYHAADQVGDWEDVVAVRMGLLLRSDNTTVQSRMSRTHDLLGVNVTTPADRHLRHVFRVNNAIRNNLP